MKKILSIIVSVTMLFIFSISAFAADFSEDQISKIPEGSGIANVASTQIEYQLEKEELPNTATTTIQFDMREEASDRQQEQVNERDIAFVNLNIAVMGENVSAEVFLSSYDGVLFTNVEGHASLYVNGFYIGSEDFGVDPILPVMSLQAGVLIETEGLEKGDEVTVFFDGTFDMLSHGSRNFYDSTSLIVE